MKYLFQNLVRSAAIAALITSTATLAFGADQPASDTKRTATQIAATPTAPRPYPFRGTVGSTDSAAKTVVLAGQKSTRLLHVDGNSKFSRDGKEITIADLRSGDYVKGLLQKSDAGETVVKAAAGEQPEPKPRARRTSSDNRRNSSAKMLAE